MKDLHKMWKNISCVSDLDAILDKSEHIAIGIFKHSTRCSISRTVLNQFEKQFEHQENINFYYLDLLNYRSISKEIATKFDVTHQSPQFILIKDRKVILAESHNQIVNIELDKLLH